MLQEGKLTTEEAERLQHSIDDEAERVQEFTAAVAAQHSSKSKLTKLLVAYLIIFLLGVITSWMLTLSDVPERSMKSSLNNTQSGRLIDLNTLSDERRTSMSQSIKLSSVVAVAVIVAVLGLFLAILYNGLIDAREQVNAAWAQVENVYQRRLDLVPVLIDGVKTYMEHERETLEELTNARANAVGVQSTLKNQGPDTVEQMKTLEAAQGRMESALAKLFAVVENYPDLKASQNFLTLQDQIEGTENRVAMERRRYNEFSRLYNSKILKFPYNLITATMDFEHKPYFQAEAKALEGLQDPFGRVTQ